MPGVVRDDGVAGRAAVVETQSRVLLVMVALPAVLVSLKLQEPVTLVIAALPAVLLLKKDRMPALAMIALPAVLLLKNCRMPGGVVDEGAAAVNDDASAIEHERLIDGKNE